MQDLASLVKATMRAELRQSGRTPAYARMAQLSGGLRDSMMRSAAARTAADPGTEARLSQCADDWSRARTGAPERIGAVQRSVHAGSLRGSRGEDGARASGPGSPARNSGLQSQPQSGGSRKEPSLARYIAQNGGLPLDAEAAARDWGSWSIPGVGKVARPNGRPVDGYPQLAKAALAKARLDSKTGQQLLGRALKPVSPMALGSSHTVGDTR
jgi:hypothetical protein